MYTIKWVIWHHGCNLLSNGSGKRIYSLVCVYGEKEKMINVAKCWLLGNLERECGHSLCCYGNFPVRTWRFLITNINKFQDILNENCNKVQESVYYATQCKWRRGASMNTHTGCETAVLHAHGTSGNAPGSHLRGCLPQLEKSVAGRREWERFF